MTLLLDSIVRFTEFWLSPVLEKLPLLELIFPMAHRVDFSFSGVMFYEKTCFFDYSLATEYFNQEMEMLVYLYEKA